MITIKPDFRFRLQNNKTMVGVPIGKFTRWIFRYTCNHLWRQAVKHKVRSYQFFGTSRTMMGDKEIHHVMGDMFQIIHCLLTIVGYDCSINDVMGRCGISDGDLFHNSKEYDANKVWNHVDSDIRRHGLRGDNNEDPRTK